MDEYDGGFDFPGILKDFQTMNKVFGNMVKKKFCAKSTCNKYLTVYKHGEFIRTDPFGEYKLEMEETDRGYLTEEELQTIANTVFADKQTNLVRDMFLFGCFTGLSYFCGGKYSPFLKKATVCTSSGDSIPVPIQNNTLRIASFNFLISALFVRLRLFFLFCFLIIAIHILSDFQAYIF